MKELRLFKDIEYGKEKITVRLVSGNSLHTVFSDHTMDAEEFYALVEAVKATPSELTLPQDAEAAYKAGKLKVTDAS